LKLKKAAASAYHIVVSGSFIYWPWKVALGSQARGGLLSLYLRSPLRVVLQTGHFFANDLLDAPFDSATTELLALSVNRATNIFHVQ
jgi:hypothetical protein